MNSCVFLSVALLIVVAVHADIVADLNAHYKACAEENNISTEQLNSLRSTVDKYSIQASDDLKCLARCVIDKNNIVSGDGINVERHVETSVALGRNEAKARSNIEKCKDLKTSNMDCAEAWNLYACMVQQ